MVREKLVCEFVSADSLCLQIWTGTHFQRISMRDMGLRIQLGHPPMQRCANPQQAWGDDFVVVDITGVHSIALDFCNCETAQSHSVQLLHARLFPATAISPKTAATFSLLQHFHLLSAQANVSGFQFYATLERCTDNTGLTATKVTLMYAHHIVSHSTLR